MCTHAIGRDGGPGLDRRLFLALAGASLAAGCRGGGGPNAAPARTTSTTTTTTTSTTTTTTTTAAPVAIEPTCPVAPARRLPDPARPTYALDIDVDPGRGLVFGEVRVGFTPDLPTDRLVFRLWPNGPRPATAGVRMEVGDIAAAEPVTTELPNPTTLVVRFERTIAAGETVSVGVPFRVEIPGSVRDRISKDGDALRLGSFFPLLAWVSGTGWALDPPTSGFAESVASPVADVRATIRVPAGYDVLASALPDADGQYRAVAVRDFAMTVGRFDRVEGVASAGRDVAVVVGSHPGGGRPGPYLAKVIDVLEDFSQRYGPYPWPSYTLSLTPGLRGGIEFPAHVMQGPDSLGRTTSHEVAHMWFYGLVGSNQGAHPWIDEGLASWAEARYEGSIESFRSRAIPSAGRGRAGEPMTYWEQHQSAYYRSVYVQSAVALSDLGDAALVDCALAHYVASNAHQIAGPRDVFRSLQAAFPDPAAALEPYGLRV